MKNNTVHGASECTPMSPITVAWAGSQDTQSRFSLHICDYIQRNLSMTAQHGLLLLLILLQASLFVGHLIYQRHRIEDNATRILRNTALLEAQQFDTSMEAMRYQVRVIGNAILLNHTVLLEDADPFLAQELKRDWLDAVIVFDANGDFVAQNSDFPLERALNASTLTQKSFRDRPLFKDLRREEVTDRLLNWQGNGDDPNLVGFLVYRAIRDPQGRYLGGAVGYFNSTSLTKLFLKMEGNGFDLGPGGVMAVVDRDSAVELARMGVGAETKTFHPGRPIPGLMRYANDVAQAHHYISPLDGAPRLGVFINLNERKWVLGVATSERDILRGWYFQVFWSALAMIVIAIMQWLLLHHIRTNFLQREHLAQEARQDPLTGLANRRRFNEWAQGTCSLARRHQQPLCVLTLDLDFFKHINDSYGHDGGDEVLRCVGATLQGLLRKSDIAARFGGEEFVVAMAHTELDVAREVAERIRANFAIQEVEFNGQRIRFTTSLGLTQMTPDELEVSEGIHAALARADQALYRSKQEGRNRVTVVC